MLDGVEDRVCEGWWWFGFGMVMLLLSNDGVDLFVVVFKLDIDLGVWCCLMKELVWVSFVEFVDGVWLLEEF